MLARLPDRPGLDAFLAWEREQSEKWEYVAGRAVRWADRKGLTGPHAMAGALRVHNRMVARIVTALNRRLGDGPCLATSSDLRVRTDSDRYRYPDVVVDCGPEEEADTLYAEEPRIMIEVLSPSNDFAEQLQLLDEFRAVPSVQQVLFFDQMKPFATQWLRTGDFWPRNFLEGIGTAVDLPSIGVSLPFSEVYAGRRFET